MPFMFINTSFRTKSPRNETTNGYAFIINVLTDCRWWRLLHVTVFQITEDKVTALRIGNTETATLFSGCSRNGNLPNVLTGEVTVGPPFESAVASFPICHILLGVHRSLTETSITMWFQGKGTQHTFSLLSDWHNCFSAGNDKGKIWF